MHEDAGPSAEVYGAQCTSAKLNYQKQYIQSLKGVIQCISTHEMPFGQSNVHKSLFFFLGLNLACFKKMHRKKRVVRKCLR